MNTTSQDIFWKTIEQNELEKFLSLTKSEMSEKYRNCFVLTTAQIMMATKQGLSIGKKPYQLMDMIIENHTENKKVLSDGSYTITIKNTRGLIDAEHILYLSKPFTENDLIYIEQFEYAHVMQKYSTNEIAHFVFCKADEIANHKELQADFEYTTIHLYRKKGE